MHFLFADRPGRANITGPAYAVKGDAASLKCSVTDHGNVKVYSFMGGRFMWVSFICRGTPVTEK